MSLTEKNETVLITGASGYLAAWTVYFALEQGYKVRGTVRDPSNEQKTKHLTSLPGAKERLELVKMDLLKSTDDEIDALIKGVDHVLHLASPFSLAATEDELIKPAVQGTTKVVNACIRVGGEQLKNLVVTSSCVAAGLYGLAPPENEFLVDETTWSDPFVTPPYPKSKVLAEMAAWKIYKEANPKFDMCTINPSFILGPSLNNDLGESTETIKNFLTFGAPLTPKLTAPVVDVRDVANAHLKCLTHNSRGRRFIISTETTLFMREMGELCRPFAEKYGYERNLPKGDVPMFVLWLVSLVSKDLGKFYKFMNVVWKVDNTPSKNTLGLEYMDVNKTISDACHSCVYHKLVPATDKYKAPSEDWTPLTS